MSRPLPRPRPDIEGLAPYSTSGTSAGRILLHANENPYPLPEAVMKEVTDAVGDLELNRYPAPEPLELRDELAAYAGTGPEWVWVGDGANEVLLQACLAYGGPGRTALVFEPTYRMHYRQARMAGTAVEVRPRAADMTIDTDAAIEAIERLRPDVVFVCTPNNPTGTVTPRDDVLRIASAAPGLVVVDEAYYEFCGATLAADLPEHPNVLLVRTLSKAFRLAGLRIGYGIADPRLLEWMRAVRMPYAQSSVAQAIALVVLRRRDEVLETVPLLVAERDRLLRELRAIADTTVYESGANFVLFRPPDPDGLLEALGAAGIVVRDFRHLAGCEGCLRVSVGTPDENDAFLQVVAAQ